MRILLTGATGFIGRALLKALHSAGHTLVCVSRKPPAAAATLPRVSWVCLDFEQAVEPHAWLAALQGVDVVINAVGILREAPGQGFEALHHRAPVALFDACVQAGVQRVLQISALGADAQARSAYHLSKRAADDHLLALPLNAVVLQPSVVFGPGGASARLFLGLASLPLLPLPAGGHQPLQPVHLDDLVQAVVTLVAEPLRCRGQRLPIVGPQALSLADYLAALRQALGWPAAWRVAVPAPLVALAARLGDGLPGALLDSQSWQMLQRGNTGPADALCTLLGRSPRAIDDFVPAEQAAGWRHTAAWAWLQPLLRASLAAVWLATAAVSAGLYPVAQSYELLARSGVPPAWQPLMLYGAVGLDLLLGVLTLWRLSPAARRRLWLAQAALITGYTLIISVRLPEFWLHPYGPLTKNLPILALLLLLYAMEPREAERRWTT